MKLQVKVIYITYFKILALIKRKLYENNCVRTAEKKHAEIF